VIKVNAGAYARLIKALRTGDRALTELAEVTGLHYLTVAHYTRALHKAGEVHVSRLRADTLGRMSVKLFTLGPGIDAKRDPMSVRERKRRQRARESREEAVKQSSLKRPRQSKAQREMLAMIRATGPLPAVTAPTEPLLCTGG
jgi:DNA-binding IclR family transcriptional regulator